MLELVWLVSPDSNAPLEWTVAKTVVEVFEMPTLLPTVVMKLVGSVLVETVTTLLCDGRLLMVVFVCLTKPVMWLHVDRVLVSARLDYLSTEWHRMELRVQCII